MTKKGTYYLGRIIKLGVLDTDKLIYAILNPKPIVRRDHEWTFIDGKEFKSDTAHFIYGRLAKYSPNAEIPIIDPALRTEVRHQAPNLREASSPFVYIPKYSGIAFLHVWNNIEVNIFMHRFCEIVVATHEGWFVDCLIEPITNLKTFAMKLSALDSIYELSAKVYPPNPMFGPLWKELKEYMASRDTAKMKIEEEGADGKPLKTNLPKHIDSIVSNSLSTSDNISSLPIGDAAIVMAADGYGTGFIKGKQGSETVIIRTSKTIHNFGFHRDPDPYDLYEKAVKRFEAISQERHMEH